MFTSEEAWKSLGNASSIHLEEFLTPNEAWRNANLAEKINRVKEIRRLITTKIEVMRKDKIVGSSLQASVVVYDSENKMPDFSEEFWNEITITSGFKILREAVPSTIENIDGIGIDVVVATGHKCERCWKIVENLDENNLCERCQQVVKHC